MSFHGEHLEAASQIRKALISQDITVVCYDPNNRWPDGPMQMLRQMVTECHCVVYFSSTRPKSRFVRFELRIAREFAIDVVRLRSIRELGRAVAQVREAAKKTHRPDLLWGLTVSRAISASCEELEAADIVASEVDRTGSTGLDLFGRHFGMKLVGDLASKFALSTRDKVVFGCVLAAALLLIGGAVLAAVRYVSAW